MKYLLSLLLIPLFAVCLCTCGGKDVLTLTVKVEGPPLDSIVYLYTTDSLYSAPLDVESRAEIIIPKDKKLAYAYIKHGFRKYYLYLEHGMDLHMVLNIDKYIVKETFHGENAEKNKYLNQSNVKSIDFDVQLDETEFIASLQNAEKRLFAQLDSFSFDNAFVQQERVRLHHMVYNHLLSYPDHRNYMFKDANYKCSENYYKCLQASFIRDDSMVDVPGYVDNMGYYIAQLAQKGMPLFDPWIFTNKCMNIAVNYFGDPSILENFIHPIVMEYIGCAGIANLDEICTYYKKNLFSKIVIDELKKEGEKWQKLSKGQPAPEFEFQDLKDQTYHLKDFRGKYVFLDVWTTWCGPCRKQMPYLEQLKMEMKGKNIVFLTVSSDEDIQKWKDTIEKMNLSGWQLHVDHKSTFYKDYLIDGIPRFILLDKEGCIFEASVTHPSNPQTLNLLNSLEGI